MLQPTFNSFRYETVVWLFAMSSYLVLQRGSHQANNWKRFPLAPWMSDDGLMDRVEVQTTDLWKDRVEVQTIDLWTEWIFRRQTYGPSGSSDDRPIHVWTEWKFRRQTYGPSGSSDDRPIHVWTEWKFRQQTYGPSGSSDNRPIARIEVQTIVLWTEINVKLEVQTIDLWTGWKSRR